jgi:hypothetical protein
MDSHSETEISLAKVWSGRTLVAVVVDSVPHRLTVDEELFAVWLRVFFFLIAGW